MEKIITENEFIRLWIEDNVIHFEYKPETTIDLEAAKKNLDLLVSISQGGEYLVLQDMNNLKWLDKESRDYIASHPITNNMIAWAFFSSKPIHNVMYLMYVKFSRPEVVSEFFKYPEDALKWLRAITTKN